MKKMFAVLVSVFLLTITLPAQDVGTVKMSEVSVATAPAAASPSGIVVHNASEAAAALLHFSGVSVEASAVLLLLVTRLSSYVRTYLLRNSTTEAGLIARTIAHLAADPLPAPASTSTASVGLNLTKQ